ncbi:hypothetical protein JYU34_002241 [Plutella xylostella]|uniref:Regulatory protein zeste n=1 Tax=Plutella xylostella TaxID=51655 RepID=A0ABQ7R1N8_PLUXY|nr:hypothetical protein JYU34_002241 [Plutella xylostella]
MTEPAPAKRRRSANWDMDEKKLMRDVIKPYLHIIETKKLTLEANAAKINAWKEITEKFNKVNDTTRSMKQIMIQWKINKNICKAKFAAHCIPKMGPLKVLKPVTPTAPPLKLGVTIIKEEPQETSSNLIELDSYNVMGSTLKGSKMTNVVITCAKPKASTLKEDGNIQKLVVIPASITQSETTDPLETKQEIPETENDPLAMLEDVIIPVPVEIPEITEEIVTEQLDDEYYDDIADTAAPTSPEVVKEEMAEEVPAIATSPKDVSKSPEREAEKVLEEDPAIPKVTTDDVPQSSEEIAEKIAAVVPGEATNTEPAQKPIRRRRKCFASRPSYRQGELLVEYLERNPELARGLLKTAQGRRETKKKWISLALTLNAVSGSIKDGRGWCKYWTEKKCYLKRICARNLAMRRPGGGPSDLSLKLSDLEQRMVAVMGGEEFATATGDQHLTTRHVDHEPEEVATREGSCDQLPSLETASCSGQWQEVNVEADPEPIIGEVQTPDYIVIEEQHPEQSSGSDQSPHNSQQSCRRRRNQLDIEVDRMTAIEEKRVEAELLTARALGDLASAFRDGVNVLKEIAQYFKK